jgi:hypothetical protein
MTKTNWHKHFALLPVKIGQSNRWLQVVERRGRLIDIGWPGHPAWAWEYREDRHALAKAGYWFLDGIPK